MASILVGVVDVNVIDSSTTRASLLIRIRNPQDDRSWEQFAEIYGPMIHRFATKQNLQHADAADVTQEVLRSVARSIGSLKYDPKIGRFRSWLFTVARNKIRNLVAKRLRQVAATGDSGIKAVIENQASSDKEESSLWDQEYERRILEWATEQIRDQFHNKTWQAFEMTAVDGKPAKGVAEVLGMSVGAVYIAKSRVVAQLKSQIEEVGG